MECYWVFPIFNCCFVHSVNVTRFEYYIFIFFFMILNNTYIYITLRIYITHCRNAHTIRKVMCKIANALAILQFRYYVRLMSDKVFIPSSCSIEIS